MEKIFVLIYPWSLDSSDEIFKGLENLGKKLKVVNVPRIKKEDAQGHYFQHKDKEFYKIMVNDFCQFLMTRELILALFEGSRRDFAAFKEKVREKHNYQKAKKEKHRKAIFHTSRDEDDFKKDMRVWQEYLE